MYPPQQFQYPWQQQQEQPQEQPQAPAPAWDRSAFRDQWMSSGIQNVPDMQNWLQSTGWGQHVGAGGSKGDKMYLPGGETIDAVLAAGLGGNRGGPQWTGSGNWQQEGRTPYGGGGGMGPSPQMMQGQMQQMGGQMGNPRMQQNQMHQMYRNRMQGRQQMQQQNPYQMQQYRQPQMAQRGPQMPGIGSMGTSQMMKQPQYSQNKMYY